MQSADNQLHAAAPRTRVLVIDDDTSMLQLIGSMLAAAGYDCLEAASGEEALAILDSTPGILVAISDIHMPGMDGILFLKNLSSRAESSTVPRVIFLTAHPQLEFAVAALRLGAVDFLTKPVSSAELLGAVQGAVERVRRDRAALRLPEQAVTLAQQAEALAAALRAWKHPQPERIEAASGVAAPEDGATSPASAGPVDLAAFGMNHLRRPRHASAPLGELDDVGWDLLVELLRAEKSGQRLSVSALGISAEHVSSTTALRRIQELVKAGHIVRYPDPLDARRGFVALADETRAALERYLEQVARELAAAAAASR